MNTSEIVIETLNESGLSLRSFAEKLIESLPSVNLSHATIINWRKGKTEPETDFLEAMLVAYDPGDWRFDFALTCLQAKSPLVWGRDGVVWVLRLPYEYRVQKQIAEEFSQAE